MSDEAAKPTDGEGEGAKHGADRQPTAEEERIAERVASDVDLDEVTEHEQEMAQKGASAKGEGAIE